MTNIAVQRMLVNQKEKPYSSCGLDLKSVFYRKIVDAGFSYTRMDCHELCKQKRIEDVCECYLPNLLRVAMDPEPCDEDTEMECVNEQFESFNDDFNVKCNEMCPLECEKMIFSTVYSQLNQFSRERASIYVKNPLVEVKFNELSNVTYEKLLRSVVRFNVFYDSLSLIEVTEKPNFTTVDLISNMGGTFGLFLGISVLSLLEIVEFCFEIVISKVKNHKTNPL